MVVFSMSMRQENDKGAPKMVLVRGGDSEVGSGVSLPTSKKLPKEITEGETDTAVVARA
jgi:hypothetical protein